MTGCRRSCRHRAFVNDYLAARAASEEAIDDAVGVYGYGSQEWQEYVASNPAVTFKQWLQQMKGWND